MSQKNSSPECPASIALGDRVWVDRLKDHGLVVALSDNGRRAVVEVGIVRFSLELSCLAPSREKVKSRGRKADVARPPRMATVPREIDMHGLRVEEMLVRFDQFLNDALLGGVHEIRVIHGHGSGALKNALHKRLKEIGIGRYRLGEPGQNPGGDGVTIISL
jgi:DNA mismatch repair protein MutS2